MTLPWMDLADTPGMDAREAEKAGALQPKPLIGEAVQGGIVVGANQASQCPSQMGNKSRVTRRMGSIKDSTSVLSIANYVVMHRTKVNRKELKIDITMECGQSRLIAWHLLANLGKLHSAKLKWSARRDFYPTISNFRMVCFAEPTRPLDANSLELRSQFACWNFRNFTVADWCNLTR